MKEEKLIKILKIVIVVLLIFLVIAIPVSIITYNKEEPLEENECTKKGNVCTANEIYKGVEVEIAVNDNKKQRFYVISNDEEKMTLIMNKNITKESDWHAELVNLKGPGEVYNQLLKKTKKWDNIDIISDYLYEDSAKRDYELACATPESYPTYECSKEDKIKRGYDYVKIENGTVTLGYNLPYESEAEKPQMTYVIGYKARARAITLEEVKSVMKNQTMPTWLVKNLKENEGYWTLTASTSYKTSYNGGATAIAKVDGKTSVESLFVMGAYEPDYTIGIRPVITVNKK